MKCNQSNSQGLILAAGRGSRLGINTIDKPKCMNTINGKRLIDYQIDAMRSAGIKDIIIVTGYMSNQFTNLDCTLIHNELWNKGEMIDSMMKAEAAISKDEIIISYGDIFYETQAIKNILDIGENITILYDVNWKKTWEMRFENIYDDAESFRLDKDSYVREIGKPIDNDSKVDGQYMGLLKMNSVGWKDFIEKYSSLKNSKTQITGILQHLVEDNYKIKAIPYYGRWGEIDTTLDLNLFNKLFKDAAFRDFI